MTEDFLIADTLCKVLLFGLAIPLIRGFAAWLFTQLVLAEEKGHLRVKDIITALSKELNTPKIRVYIRLLGVLASCLGTLVGLSFLYLSFLQVYSPGLKLDSAAPLLATLLALCFTFYMMIFPIKYINFILRPY